jgi:hypothetical protein
MKRRRSETFLASKTKERTRDESLRRLDESLKLLATDHLDLWQLHDIGVREDVEAVYLVDEVSDGTGSLVRRQTLLLQIVGDGRLITDNGRTYHVRPFPVQPGQAQIRNGRLELPNTQQRPGIPVLKSNN